MNNSRKRRNLDLDDVPSCSHAAPAKRRELEKDVGTANATRRQTSTALTTQSHTSTRNMWLQEPHYSALSMSQLGHTVLRCGKITRLHLENFMCHENLTIDFHPRINFLVGSNGSGKSAILAALMLGLGAKAKDTSRSSNMQNLIRTSQSMAKIEITLSNEGPQAYEPEKYGDRITIVRTINQTASTYAIKGASGRMVSRKLDELHHILMYHNVQVDNPIFVLNQDASREMLKELEPKSNYKIFLKATQIESVSDKLSDCFHMNVEQKENLKTLEEKLKRDKLELQSLSAKLEQLTSLGKLKDTIDRMELEHLWLLVANEEEALQRVNDSADELKQKLKKMQRIVMNKDEMTTQLTQSISCIVGQIEDETGKYSSQNTVYMQKKTILQNIEDQCTRIGSDIDSCKRRIDFFKNQISELRKNIEERSDTTGIAATRAHNEAKLNDLHKQQAESTIIMATAQQDLKLYVDDYMHIEEQLKRTCDQREEYRFKILSLNQEIDSMQSASKDQLAVYGPHVVQFLIEINKAHKAGRFSKCPRGPIGRYVEVPNEQYRNVIEFQLRPILHAFIVCNTKDRLTLTGILQQQQFANYRPRIITTPFADKVYDVSRGCVLAPMRGTRQMMSEILCRDPVVMNCLIDQVQIETILLADTKEVAEQITSDSQNVPAKLKKVIVLNPCIEYFPDPHYRMYHLRIGEARFIQVNVKDRIMHLKKKREMLEIEMKKTEANLKETTLKANESKNRAEMQRSRLRELESSRRELRERIMELEQFEYPRQNEVDFLKEELTGLEKQIIEYNTKLCDKEAELAQTTKDRHALQTELRGIHDSMNAMQQKINEYNNNCSEKRGELRAIDTNFKTKQQQLCELERIIAEKDTEIDRLQTRLSNAARIASERGERVPSELDVECLLNQIQENKAKLKQRSQNHEDPETIRRVIKVKELDILTSQTNFKNMRKTHEHLRKSLTARLNFLKEFRNHMSLIISHTFSGCCKLRNYLGTINLDHEKKALTISVKPRDQHLANAVSSTRCLSGGERSFATVAFLLSLWACVDHPFYILDEYDVFTDEVNREFITRLLIDEGKSHIDRQYAFLTPQALNLQHDEYLQIHRFSVPKRK